MVITAALVKQLRGMTGAGMMDCKKALAENGGELDPAIDWLRKKGLAKAAKKAGRVAVEGLVSVTTSGNVGAVIELNSETDFVARNAEFQEMVGKISQIALEKGESVTTLSSARYPDSDHTVSDEVADKVATIGENMTLRRSRRVVVNAGIVGSYVHNASANGMGSLGVLVGLETSGNADGLETLARQLAMHVAAADPAPLAVSPDDLDQEILEKERKLFSEQAAASGKPENVVTQMVEGRIRKYLGEVCLLSQTFVIDGESKISALLKNAETITGAPVRITEFVRFALGEGIEKEQVDFAAEVAAATGAA